MARKTIARFGEYVLTEFNGNRYVAVYRKPHLCYSIEAFLHPQILTPPAAKAALRELIA